MYLTMSAINRVVNLAYKINKKPQFESNNILEA